MEEARFLPPTARRSFSSRRTSAPSSRSSTAGFSAGRTSARRATIRVGSTDRAAGRLASAAAARRTTEGALVVSSLADLFASDGDAAEDFELYQASLDQFATAGGREVSVSGLGDEARAVTFSQGLKPNVIHHYAIAWRDGPVTASVTANGFKLTWPQALALARAQEARIRAASG